jgi:hypothetical protein
MLAVLLIDGQGVCHGRPYLSEKAHCTAISSNLQPFEEKKDCGPKFWDIPLRQWETPLKEGNFGANPNFLENVPHRRKSRVKKSRLSRVHLYIFPDAQGTFPIKIHLHRQDIVPFSLGAWRFTRRPTLAVRSV